MQYKAPGVYIKEMPSFKGVAPVQTSTTAFVGYTQTAASTDGTSLHNQAQFINSLVEYETLFGKGPQYKFVLLPGNAPDALLLNGNDYTVVADGVRLYKMYNSIRLFYANGGGACCIVSVGDYNTTPTLADMQSGIDTLLNVADVSILVVPDATLLNNADYNALMNYMLSHCDRTGNRVAILDTYSSANIENDINAFRGAIQDVGRPYGVAYYPWINTTITQPGELNYTQFTDLQNYIAPADMIAYNAIMQNTANAGVAQTDEALLARSSNYQAIKQAALHLINILPPSAALAGVYTSVDNAVGVWKAPANVSLQAVASPVLSINNNQQEGMNVPVDGKAVNAIRSFTGRGLLVWGARTLDGNSTDWRYISVRRTMIMIEQSIKMACQAYVFEPNDANTWAAITISINSFLTELWKQGALLGAKTADAFFVKVGLGSTMTTNDLLDGYLIVEVGVALLRPAEFTIFTFQQQMQTS